MNKVTQNINKIKKARYIGSEDIDMTFGKLYNVIEDSSNEYYCFKDDVRYERIKPKSSFEEVKEPNYVMVKDSDCDDWEKRILLHDLGEQFKHRYITLQKEQESNYMKNKNNLGFCFYKQMKPINEVEQKIEELEKELAELKQQLNK